MTAQDHERLILDGMMTGMAFCPPIPEKHTRIKVFEAKELRRMDEANQRLSMGEETQWDLLLYSSACRRRYRGTWLIEGGRFYLAGLTGRLRLTLGEPLFADWFSGVLRVPRGEPILHVNSGFDSIYEEELHIGVENGVVLERYVRDIRGSDCDPFAGGHESLRRHINPIGSKHGPRRRLRHFLDN